MDSAQRELDNISREPHEFTHPVPAYQILASQSNLEVEQTLGLVHTEQSLRNVKASTASASNTTDDNEKEFGEDTLRDSSKDEGKEWISREYFTTEDVQEEVKTQYKKDMKKHVLGDPKHKKLASFYMDNLKLHIMQLVGLNSKMKL